jgi:hypothetical protein
MSMPMIKSSPRFLFAGQLTRDFIIFPSGETLLDVPGGNLLYAAAGLMVWEPSSPPGLVARVGEDYPEEWMDDFQERGFDTQGIQILPQAVDVRSFVAYLDRNTRSTDDPVSHFARLGLPFPKMLLGYKRDDSQSDSRSRLSPISLRQSDLAAEYLDATAAHICPLDFLSHSLLPAVLRQAGLVNVTLDPSPGYMKSAFWGDIPALVTGLTAFLPSEEEIRDLFQGRSSDLWEMAEALASFGCELVVIKCGERGQRLYEAATRTCWEIPPYPAKVIDTVGAGDAFCGGFLAGYRRTYDPVMSVLYGNISASLAIEGHSPFYPLGTLPGLPEARLEALQQSVRKI